MKEIKAYIKKHKLDKVIRALHKIQGLTGMSVIEQNGYGICWANAKIPDQIELNHGVKLEIICRDEIAESVIETIKNAAYTGLKDDGKIYMNTIELAIRISTGERGEGAS